MTTQSPKSPPLSNEQGGASSSWRNLFFSSSMRRSNVEHFLLPKNDDVEEDDLEAATETTVRDDDHNKSSFPSSSSSSSDRSTSSYSDSQDDDEDEEYLDLFPIEDDDNNDWFYNSRSSKQYNQQQEDEEDEDEHVTINKSHANTVGRLKLTLAVVLSVSAVVVSASIYFYTSRSQQEHFLEQYTDDARKVLESIGSSLFRTLGAVDLFGVSVLSYARDSNQTWPFVTVRDYAEHASKTRALSDVLMFSVCPLVKSKDREKWADFAAQNLEWINDTLKSLESSGGDYFGPIDYNYKPRQEVWTFEGPSDYERNYSVVSWQSYPLLYNYVNFDLLSLIGSDYLEHSIKKQHAAISIPYLLPDENDEAALQVSDFYLDYINLFLPPEERLFEPYSDFVYPLTETRYNSATGREETETVAALTMSFVWRAMIRDILPDSSRGIVAVIENPCGASFSYEINGPNVTFLGKGDLHSSRYDDHVFSSELSQLRRYTSRTDAYSGAPLEGEYCPFTVSIYPSDEMRNNFVNNIPFMLSLSAFSIFLFTTLVFALYDWTVELRNQQLLSAALRTSRIVSSLFPSGVRHRLYPQPEQGTVAAKGKATVLMRSSKQQIQSYLHSSEKMTRNKSEHDNDPTFENMMQSPPIAELYPDTTVMFADIAGFTAWSSARDPAQVFTLLETIYGAFDVIAKRRGVFKVETIGDSYVAVCGLPTPRRHHAVVMARFARDCRTKMKEVTRKLETTLGPDTGELKLRFGLNSGPTTAGVLRGEKSRFQLFGDTVNTAARMESNGETDRIQCSQKTADQLISAGKGDWIEPRKELINAKGKGLMQCYWVEPFLHRASWGGSTGFTDDSMSTYCNNAGLEDALSTLTIRLVNWNVDVFEGLLKQMVASRPAQKTSEARLDNSCAVFGKPLDEVTEIITLPKFDSEKLTGIRGSRIDLGEAVQIQLRRYIAEVASLYRDNPFHNFEHASHVVMSTTKLLQRVVSPDISIKKSNNHHNLSTAIASTKHNNTFGITSDPLTQFAIVFAALIHDVDHPGVSNFQLVQEQASIASHYDGKSVAEQNSVDIAWKLLMQPGYEELQHCIFPSQSEMRRFRQLVVNAVMATDIFDKDLKKLREMRWEKAFANSARSNYSNQSSSTTTATTASSEPWPCVASNNKAEDDLNRRATIVIEHIIQASDVSHNMQHWKIYQKWNQCLFKEMYLAYKNGRSEKDPSEGWYEGELWFYDNYIIPLAKKLKECGVFGVSCDEFLDYAIDNRAEWESTGRQVVHELSQEVELIFSQENC